jgi:hypothetical protein
VQVNLKFQSNYVRLVLPIPILEEVYKKEKVTEDRAHAIDATVVRIMKTLKRLDLNSLMNEVLSSLHLFKPQPPVIKRRIELLIEKDFLKRDETDKALLIYVA